MLNIDPNTLLAIELAVLAALVALGVWHIARRRSGNVSDSQMMSYDMRRDGPQLSV